LGQTKGISTQRERERERDERVFSVMVEHCGVGKEDKNWVELEEAVFQRLRGGIEGEETLKGLSVVCELWSEIRKKKKRHIY
jgi:hypothetical protein